MARRLRPSLSRVAERDTTAPQGDTTTMTAPAPIERIIHDEPPAPAKPTDQAAGGGTCPVRLLGARLALVAAELDCLEDEGRSGSASETHARNARIDTLTDAKRHLEAEVQWLTPRSIEGVMIVGMILENAGEDLHDFHDAPDLSHAEREPVRRFTRLHARLMEGINHLAGKTPEDIGLGHYWMERRLSGAAAAAFASID